MMKLILVSSAMIAGLAASALAQAPIVMQPANSSAAGAAVTPQAKTDDEGLLPVIQSLEELKASNDELLKKQQAQLEMLNDLQKKADELRIFAKRG